MLEPWAESVLKCCVGNYILRGQNCQKILHDLPVMPLSPLPPHLLVEVRLKILFSNTSACLLFQLKTIPAGLYLLCMDASNRVNKVASMYYNSVCCNVVYTPCHASVCSPVIGADFCSRPDTLWDYGIKCGDVPSLDNLEVSSCRAKLGSYYAKNPSIPRSSPSVVLKRGIHFGYWRKLTFSWPRYILLRHKCFLGHITRT